MFHAIKKKVAKHSASKRGVVPSAEFLDYKQRLETVKRNMELVDTKLTEANLGWSKRMIDQRSFSESFVEGYPNGTDETHAIAQEFAQGSRDLYDYFLRFTTPEMAEYHRLHDQVKVYIGELKALEETYPKVTEAKSESVRYQDKVDSLETSKKRNESKKVRNVQKLDNERERYEDLTRTVIAAQKKAFAKAPIVHKIGLCAYWLANDVHITIAMKSLERTADFARANASELSKINVAALDLPEMPMEAIHPVVPKQMPPSPTPVTRTAVKQVA